LLPDLRPAEPVVAAASIAANAALDTRAAGLQVTGLSVDFARGGGWLPAVQDVSIAIARGQTLGLVGESGSGKSVSSLAIMDLLDPRRSRVTVQTLRLGEVDLLALSAKERRRVRGRDMAMVFQDPMSALNPYLRIGDQLTEVLQYHLDLPLAQACEQAVARLTEVGIAGAQARLRSYPHGLSGGMRQRVVLAMGLLCNPQLLLADEPTTALDVTIQAQVLALLRREQQQRGLAMLLVTHDLGVIAAVADVVAVMYAGQLQEQAEAQALFSAPLHPYTVGLLASLPGRRRRGQRLTTIAGLPPLAHERPAGCTFAPRCPLATATCRAQAPEWTAVGNDRWVRCHRHADVPAYAAEVLAIPAVDEAVSHD